jgi:hypothetical protein
MYTILMNSDKSLVCTTKTTLYQRDKLVDKLQILIPQTYEDINLSDFTAVLKYVDQGNEAHSEILIQDEELYKDSYLRYTLPIDTNLTRFAGNIKICLTLNKVDMEEMKEYSLNTGETTITITPLSDYYKFVSDESLSIIDQKVNELNVKLEAVDKMSTAYDETKADNIKLDKETSEIYLTAHNKQIGDKIAINDLGNAIAEETKDGLIPIIL